jgi:hypothetical protein
MFYRLLADIAVCYMQDNIFGLYIMTTWRNSNTEGFKENIKTTSAFSNIHMFNVIENFKEGNTNLKCDPFNIFCDDYFRNFENDLFYSSSFQNLFCNSFPAYSVHRNRL